MKRIKAIVRSLKFTALALWLSLYQLAIPVEAKGTASKAVIAELNAGLKTFLTEYRVVVTAIVAIGVMTGLLAFIWLLMKLAAVADQPQARAEILKELAAVGVVTALLGSFSLLVGIYYSIMMNT